MPLSSYQDQGHVAEARGGAGPAMENESTDKIAQLSSNLYSFRRPTNEHFYNGWMEN